ncbi:2-succinyl-5-enolpyruvyl-6-hydroxy-3-cyclohexene-1-carboxylic-acid synthase [Conexibacter woesei]|uniref:2-succinyl-5-enolpyruvyl-6-hydroxy-3-cyclohexene-1-carboxylate synthase n=1 Tax=Conexibacter woesei (strain DSM 14684 / CCUG 47730 / CIP 108061 / JCM 11494 / NBRC 100937 / ID131577) TaxID=469383 RepID=D3F0D3_CONWI|nr:2-succinyl-5-enolpyruvyl-6-hydroxy-3-cyclohexene-1-carboxylic-acid synthase [Conexibacter woesei]ADB51993.1 2-succinyl-6-hydroxy-2,4-cyclohexadiene-1- carboxylic acid synthase/2-oxoglutarate decarboxylase [Conexibacter woesei DSM 14684]
MTTTATDTYVLLRAFCDELARCGVTDACTSPGSRSTPLVLSLARGPGLRAWSHVDERVAGFFAVGLAKQTGRAVAIAVTSGTAAAELAPAVIEAAEARVPLIVLTADRPPELRDVGAGQTIDQVKLFGGAAKQFVEVGVVGAATAARVRWMRQLACRAVWTAQDGRPGVVHLNVPLREPLVLDGPLPDDPAPGRGGGRPWVARTRVPLPADAPELGIVPARHGVIVAGRTERGEAVPAAVVRFAEAAGYALLADPLSGARAGTAAVAHYDALLRDPGFAASAVPDLVVRVGDLPTSKPLRAWLATLPPDVPQIALDPEGSWHDPDGVVSERVEGSLPVALSALTGAHADAGDPAWLERWRAADAAAARAIDATIGTDAGEAPSGATSASATVAGATPTGAASSGGPAASATAASAPLNEPLVARELVAALAPGATLFVAASMPIRDVETFAAVAPGAASAPRILSNRGANGIDGTVASALGAAAAGRGPVVLLIGDVALAYDLSALLSARRHALDLTIVLVDNDGGGIFHFLPVASQTDAFEEHVATPHGLDFAAAAALYGARHALLETAADLRAELGGATRPGAGVTILQARTDREQNVVLHRRVWDAVRAELASG